MEGYRKALTSWYNHSKRDLPWRETRDPYPVWVSEVILQQTRVKQGMDYYFNFLRNFPNLASLANATEEEVLKCWQGLGYYSRARNMHQAAKTIQSIHHGHFPKDYPAIRKLKGIGDYTAAAIASICYGLPYATVDGNVYRVLSRLFGIDTPIDSSVGKEEFRVVAQLLLDTKNPGEFNQALMEFGALQCLPSQPACITCPLADRCQAYLQNNVAQYPVKSKRVMQRERFFNYLYVFDDQGYYLEKREGRDIWKNMYQLPLLETATAVRTEDLIMADALKTILGNARFTIESSDQEVLHLLTHQRLRIRFTSIRLSEGPIPAHWIKVTRDGYLDYPMPKPIEQYLKKRSDLEVTI